MALWSVTFYPTGDFETWVAPRHAPGSLVVTLVGGKGHDAGPSGSLRSRGGDGGSITGVLNIDPGLMVRFVCRWIIG